MSLLTFFFFGADKRRARQRRRRFPERTLLAMSLLGGGLGAGLGMLLFRHKTLHRRFRVLVPLGTLLWALVLLAAWAALHLDFFARIW